MTLDCHYFACQPKHALILISSVLISDFFVSYILSSLRSTKARAVETRISR